jgi:hypothetical protein
MLIIRYDVFICPRYALVRGSPAGKHANACVFLVNQISYWRLIVVKAIFKEYEYNRAFYSGEVYHTATKFNVVGSKMTTGKLLRFVEKHVNSHVSFRLDKHEKWLSGYFYAYDIMKDGKWIGYCNFIEGEDSAFLTYYDDLHDVGLTYGDYELDYETNKNVISIDWYNKAS